MSSKRTQRQYIAILAAVSAVILIVGSRLRPGEVPDVRVTQAEMARLQGLAQRQNLERLTGYFAQIADSVKPVVVWLEGIGHSGVVWGATGRIVTAVPRQLPVESVTARGLAGDMSVAPQVLSPLYPAAALESAALSQIQPVFHGAARTLGRGSWILHLAGTAGGVHLQTPGHFEGVVRATCGGFPVDTVVTTLPLTERSLGGGVFSLDGDLLALVLDCDGSPLAVTPDGVDRILEQADSFEGQLMRRYGFRAVPLAEREASHFGTDSGLLITETALGMPSSRAGIQPGDILQALDDTPVSTPDDLARLALPVAYPTYRIDLRRRGRRLRVDMEAVGSDYVPVREDAALGIELDRPVRGFLIEQVRPGGPAERAALAPGDRLLTVDGRTPASREEAAKALRGSEEPLFVVVERGSRRLGVFLAE